MTVSIERLQVLLSPYMSAYPEGLKALPLSLRAEPFELSVPLLQKLCTFLDLLLRWNAVTNLTAIRDPEQIVQRHFGESFFAARHLSSYVPPGAAVLDFGSGAGFPGIPIQLLHPEFRVTLAESQGKKAAFLREASRVLDLKCEVWANRVENLPAARIYKAVTMRAVDDWEKAMTQAQRRVAQGGVLAVLAGASTPDKSTPSFSPFLRVQVPESSDRWLELWSHAVPRGTVT